MSLKLYFVRHGQAESNLCEGFYNDAEAELTAIGRVQAEELGLFLRNLNEKFVAVYCSPYKRARDTCAIVLKYTKMEYYDVAYDDRIIERRFDGLFEKTVSTKDYIELYDYDSDLSKSLGVETLDHLEDRARSFIEELKTKYESGNVLAFSHGVFGLAVHTVVNGRPASNNMHDLQLLKNCKFQIFELK